MKLNFFRKLKLYLEYRRGLNLIKDDLYANFNARVDFISRIYTVLNLPPDSIEEPYTLRKSDIDAIAKNFIREYSSELGKYLNKNGLSELYDFYDITKVDKYSYLLIFGFALFDMKKVVIRVIIFILILFMSIVLLHIFKY